MNLSYCSCRLAPSATRAKSIHLNTSQSLLSSPSSFTPHRTAVWDAFRRKKRNIIDPLNPDFMKFKPAPLPSQSQPQTGDLAPNSIFEEGEPNKAKAPDVASQERPSPTDPSVMAAALDPNPTARKRWQRKMIIREIRNRGHLTRKQQIARTEREHLSKSAMFKTSIKKLLPLARQIAGKPVEEAIVQMRFSKKRVARDVKKHLEYARDEAIVARGMGLGNVNSEQENREPEGKSDGGANQKDAEKEQWQGMVVEDRKGKRRFVNDVSSIYVDEAWVGRGSYGKVPEFRARGKINMLRPPETSISVRLKEEATRIRLMDEKEKKRQRKRVWVQLPDRPVTAQRQYCLW